MITDHNHYYFHPFIHSFEMLCSYLIRIYRQKHFRSRDRASSGRVTSLEPAFASHLALFFGSPYEEMDFIELAFNAVGWFVCLDSILLYNQPAAEEKNIHEKNENVHCILKRESRSLLVKNESDFFIIIIIIRRPRRLFLLPPWIQRD